MDSITTPHRAAQVRLLVGCTSASAAFNISVFHRARTCRQSVFWNCADMYVYMQLKTYKGEPSNWIDRCHEQWETRLSFLGPGHIVYGNNAAGKQSARQGKPWHQRCLPNTSISTVRILALCFKWGLADQQGGGLNAGPAEAALLFAKGMLSVFNAPQFRNIMFTIALTNTWQCAWPRPAVQIDNEHVIGVGCSSGQLNLAPLLSRAQGSSIVSE